MGEVDIGAPLALRLLGRRCSSPTTPSRGLRRADRCSHCNLEWLTAEECLLTAAVRAPCESERRPVPWQLGPARGRASPFRRRIRDAPGSALADPSPLGT